MVLVEFDIIKKKKIKIRAPIHVIIWILYIIIYISIKRSLYSVVLKKKKKCKNLSSCLHAQLYI